MVNEGSQGSRWLSVEEAGELQELVRIRQPVTFTRINSEETITIYGFNPMDGSVVVSLDLTAPDRFRILTDSEEVALYVQLKPGS